VALEKLYLGKKQKFCGSEHYSAAQKRGSRY